jgi:hypothetical protein
MLPEIILVKNLNLTLSLNSKIIRYKGLNAESGAYIFANAYEGLALDLKIMKSYLYESKF